VKAKCYTSFQESEIPQNSEAMTEKYFPAQNLLQNRGMKIVQRVKKR